MTARKYPCHRCGQEATEWLPTWEGHFRRWSAHHYCDGHYPAERKDTLMHRVYQYEHGFQRMETWSMGSFPADDSAGAAAKNAAFDWLEDVDDQWFNLYIHGPVGSGKTGLAWSCGLALTESHLWEEIRFVNVRQLLTGIRRSFGSGEQQEDPLDKLGSIWCLVLDDLGAERVTDWTREWLATLIESRYVNEWQTIVTSNYSPAQLARRLGHDDPVLGKRIVSRLVDNALIIKLDRADLRLRKEAA